MNDIWYPDDPDAEPVDADFGLHPDALTGTRIARLAGRSPGIVAALALLYHRHNDPARALALGLAAMQAGLSTPQVTLLVAASFLKTGDAEQALAALSRFRDTPHRLARDPDDLEWAAAEMLSAKALFRIGDVMAARDALARAGRYRKPADPASSPPPEGTS